MSEFDIFPDERKSGNGPRHKIAEGANWMRPWFKIVMIHTFKVVMTIIICVPLFFLAIDMVLTGIVVIALFWAGSIIWARFTRLRYKEEEGE